MTASPSGRCSALSASIVSRGKRFGFAFAAGSAEATDADETRSATA